MNEILSGKLAQLRVNPTVAAWHAIWPEVYPRPSVETTRHNEQMVRSFVAAYGPRRLDAIDKLEARAWAADNRGNARYVKTFFIDAVKVGLCETNPFAGVSFQSDGRKFERALTIEDVVRAAEASEVVHPGPWGRQFGTMILMAGLCAVRLSEAALLERPNFTFKDGVPIAVEVQAKKTKLNRGRPVRKVMVVPRLRARLVEIIPETGLIFTTVTGKPHNRQSVNRAWVAVRNEIGIDVDWHGLRHAAATFYAEAGADPWAMAWQMHGHDKPSMAVEVYTHARRDEALGRLELVTG